MTETVKIDLYANNLDQTKEVATQLAQVVTAGTIILFEGDLGSGKTTFMQAFGLALGINSTIASPTFTLIDEYTEGRLPLYHIDLYRLEPSQVPSLHLEEYWRDQDFPLGVVAIEWSSKLINLPSAYLQIKITVLQSPDFSASFTSEYLPESRLMQLIAKGAKYVQMLDRFNPDFVELMGQI
jgi:tRNA threonylcarbamoyladenosine biosynthesis protein TsaE